MIERAETFYADADGVELALRAPLVAHLREGAPAEMPSGLERDAEAAIAYVNHGRWVAECPFGCGSAQVVDPADPRFFCPACQNEDLGKFVPVSFPAASRIAAIEQLLLERPDARNRNWLPHESVKQLAAENKAHLT